MDIYDIDTEHLMKERKRITHTRSSIITPLLGHNRLFKSYLRILLIARILEFLAHKSIFNGYNRIGDDLIREAVTLPNILLSNLSIDTLNLLLVEMTKGLGLLEAHDLGTVKQTDYATLLKTGEYVEKDCHVGFAFSLTDEGWEAYRSQKFQILANEMKASQISRFVSYAALIISGFAFIATILK